ncbi:MAG: M3 family oligoendopeptidase [Deltaproteobacteria bacterium]|nr:M3 family oligoendopeptidase [Deltaproteobacteria bacterium]
MGKVSTNKVSEIKRPASEFPRRFLPEEIDLADWGKIEPFYQDLLDREPGSVSELVKWLLDLSELQAALGEEGSRRYIAMTCATDDEEIKKAYMHFVEHIEPGMKTRGNELDNKFINNPHLRELDQFKYEILIRDIRNHLEIFREENVPLQTELAKLSQEYMSIQGAMTVEFQDQERTLQQMLVFLEEPDRDIRRQSWELVSERRLQDADKLNNLYDKMLGLRQQAAENAGFDNYIEFRFKELERFDYTPQDCLRFHDAVEKCVMPAYNESLGRQRKTLGLSTLRPYDLAVDPYSRPPLKPFSNPEELSSGCVKIFEKVDPDLGKIFEKMKDDGLLDLASHKGKAPGGYQSALEEVRLPFIFMNAAGLNRDVYTLLHEGGHAFHSFASREEPLLHYRHAPMEFCEVASMGMELIASNYLEEFYNQAEAARARKKNLEDLLFLFPWIATIDAFQHWLYSHPGHSTQERTDCWLALMERFGGDVDYSGYEEGLKTAWQRQLHLFEVPFYYIEYGIAQLGALQIWRKAKSDLKKTIADYKAGLALGGSRPLLELFTAAGIKFDFSEETLGPLIDDVVAEIEELARLEKKEGP